MAVGAAAVTLLIIGHPHPQAQENRATPDAAKLAAIDSGLATGNAAARPPSPPADWTVLNVDTLRDDDWGRTVRYGRDLITKTYALIGPEVADASHRYSGNNLACESCHLEAGTKKFGLPFQGVYARLSELPRGRDAPAGNQVRSRLAGGGQGIRTVGPAAGCVSCTRRGLKTSPYKLGAGGRRGSVRFVLRGEPFGGRPVSRRRRATDVEHSQHASLYRRCSPMPDYRRPSFVSLSVEPHVLHSQSVVDAVDHRGVALDIGVPAGAGTIVPEDRPGRLFRQLALDPPYQLLALDRVELH